MRLSQLLGKRIINIYDGEIMGSVGDADLVVDPATGVIESIIVPYHESYHGAYQTHYGVSGRADRKAAARGEKRVLNIPWDKVCKIGSEVIVVDVAYDDAGYDIK